MRRSELVGAGVDTAFTLSRKSRQSISTMMNRILRDSSFHPRHAMNWLKKYQFVPADRSFLLADDITDLDLIRRLLDQINTSGIKLSDSPQTTRAIERYGLVDNRYQAYDIEASMLPFQSIVDDILNPHR